jgi:hypothetical protein
MTFSLRTFPQSFTYCVANGNLDQTSTIESDLKSLAISLGVKIESGMEITSVAQMQQKVPGVDIIISAEGAKSRIRKDVTSKLGIKKEMKFNKKYGSLLQVKFDAIGQVKSDSGRLAQFLQNLPAQQTFFNILPANFDKEKNVTPITAFTVINDEVYSAFKEVPSFKGLSLEDMQEKNERRLLELAADILSVIGPNFPQGFVRQSMRVSALPVVVSIASKVSFLEGSARTPVFIVGDSAMGLPLEKGLNYGWAIASNLVRIIHYSDSMESAVESYQIALDQLSEHASKHVETDYAAYLATIRNNTLVRSLVQAASLGLSSRPKVAKASSSKSNL